jgi:hypothetical protein
LLFFHVSLVYETGAHPDQEWDKLEERVHVDLAKEVIVGHGSGSDVHIVGHQEISSHGEGTETSENEARGNLRLKRSIDQKQKR